MSIENKIADAIKKQGTDLKKSSQFEVGAFLGVVQSVNPNKVLLDNFPTPVDFIQIRTSNRMKVEAGQWTKLWDEEMYDVSQDEMVFTMTVELQLEAGDRVLVEAIKNGTEFVIIGKVMDDPSIG